MAKKAKHSEMRLSELSRKLERIESEIERIEKLEKNLVQHELILAKKARDMYAIEKKLEQMVPKKEFDEIKKDLSRIGKHEGILFENTKFMKELVREIDKVKRSHKLTRDYVMGGENVSRKDFEKHMEKVKDSLKNFDEIADKHKHKADRNELKRMQEDLHDRMSQIEYQHKLLLNLFKRLDADKRAD